MTEDVASVVICDECGDRVAEIVVEEERALCAACHLKGEGIGAVSGASDDGSEAQG